MITDPYPILEFRDGERVVPHHVAALLAGIETWMYTYEEAIRLSNQQLLRDRLNTFQRDAINSHFRENGG